jgi:hypothetical protein
MFAPAAALADTPAPPAEEAIVVYGRAVPQIGSAKSGSEGTVGYADFENRPIGRVAELAENVPSSTAISTRSNRARCG